MGISARKISIPADGSTDVAALLTATMARNGVVRLMAGATYAIGSSVVWPGDHCGIICVDGVDNLIVV